jgi:hypothetical protein
VYAENEHRDHKYDCDNGNDEKGEEAYFAGVIQPFRISIILALIRELRSFCGDFVTVHPKIDDDRDPENDIHDRDEREQKPPQHFVSLCSDKKSGVEREAAPRPSLLRRYSISRLFHFVIGECFDLSLFCHFLSKKVIFFHESRKPSNTPRRATTRKNKR